MYNNIACLPLIAKEIYSSKVLKEEILKYEYSKGCIIEDGKPIEWLRTELCLFYSEKNVEISTNWNLCIEQIKNQTPKIKKESNNLYLFIKENLKINPTFLSIQKTKGTMPTHFDIPIDHINTVKDKNFYEPCLIKILLNPIASVNKLYFSNSNSKQFLNYNNVPNDTNIYAWNNTVIKHGVKDPILDVDRIIINVYGNYQNTDYKKVLDSSYIKYKSHAIVF